MAVGNAGTAELKCFKGNPVLNFMECNFPVYYKPNVKWLALHKIVKGMLIVNQNYYWIVLGRVENSVLLVFCMVGIKINFQTWTLLQWFILDVF